MHIKKMPAIKEWLDSYRVYRGNSKSDEFELTEDILELVKYFITSNNSMIELENKHLQHICNKVLKLPTIHSFKHNILPKVMALLHQIIEKKLQKAVFISTTTDIWTNKQMYDFIAVSANTISQDAAIASIVIGMIPMPGRHDAEHIKIAVEEIINRFEFDKSKLIGITTDEGSSMLRLFKPMLNIDEIDNESSLIIDLEEAELDDLFDNDESVHDIDEVNLELNEISAELKSNHLIKNKLTSSNTNVTSDLNDLFLYEEALEYNFTKGDLIDTLSLEISTSILPHYCCSAHKMNIAVRRAIKSNLYLVDILKKLSKFAATTKRSINIAKIYIEKKSKLRIENLTRWSSSFLMIETFISAFKKGFYIKI